MSAAGKVKDLTSSNKVFIFSQNDCATARDAVASFTTDYTVMELDTNEDGPEIEDALKSFTGNKALPAVFIDGNFFGDGEDTAKAAQDGSLQKKLEDAMCNMSETKGSHPTGSRGDLNAPKGPSKDGHTGKH